MKFSFYFYFLIGNLGCILTRQLFWLNHWCFSIFNCFPCICLQYVLLIVNVCLSSAILVIFCCSGDYKAYSLPCFVRRGWFFSRWSAGTCAFPLICVSRTFNSTLVWWYVLTFSNYYHTYLVCNWHCRYQRSTTAISVGKTYFYLGVMYGRIWCWLEQMSAL